MVVVFMIMEENLERVLRKIVLPLFDRLSDVKVTKMGRTNDTYVITYFINDRIDYSDGFIIEKETKSLFDMLGPEKGESFIVQYRTIAED